MVQTRSGRRTRRLEDQIEDYNEFTRNVRQRTDQCSECEDNDNDYEYNAMQLHDVHNTRSGEDMYRQNDTCKRHRVKDNQPYTEVVSSYKRRKPQ